MKTIVTTQELLAGSRIIHDIDVPPQVLMPGAGATSGNPQAGSQPVVVRLRPLNITTLTLISRAARDDPSLNPVLMIKEALVEPVVTLEQVRQMHVGLVHFLVNQVNLISGLAANGSALSGAADSPDGAAYLLLARHFGWTPEQVSQLTPGQIAIYLAGIERLLKLEEARP